MKPTHESKRKYFLLSFLSVVLFIFALPPIGISLLGFIALVPWIIVNSKISGRLQLIVNYTSGLFFFGVLCWWIFPITIPGYVSMCIYLAIFWVIAGFCIGFLHRGGKLPLWLITSLVIVMTDYIRSIGPLGFPWFFLAHTQAENIKFIQIADIGGVYIVSFVLAFTNGLLAECIIKYTHIKLRGITYRLIGIACIILIAIGYSQYRLAEYKQVVRPGPKLAVIQTDFPMKVDKSLPPLTEFLTNNLRLTRLASTNNPDIVIWPETAIPVSINPEFLNAKVDTEYLKYEQEAGREVAKIISKYADKLNTQIIVGAISKQINPPNHYPKIDKFNSALVFDKTGKYIGRYDKIKLVLFGEYVPFRYSIRWLYWILNEYMTPYGRGGYEYSLTPGTSYKVFNLKTSQGNFKYSIIICYEDTLSNFVRKFVISNGKKKIDFLVNISNDGWFNYSSELIQHIDNCVFRTIENRVPIARAVNTGISGFIDSAGRKYSLVRGPSSLKGPGIKGFSVANILIDPRKTIYSTVGNIPEMILTVFVLSYIVLLLLKKESSK